MACEMEADEIADTPHGKSFLKAIGAIIQHKTAIYTGSRNLFQIPRGIFHRFARTKRRWTGYSHALRQTLVVLKSLRELPHPIHAQSLEPLLPQMMELAWTLVLRDISKTLEEALSRILAASDLEGKRWKRAQALQQLAQVFLSRAGGSSSNSSSWNEEEDHNSMKATVRCKVAFGIAQNKGDGVMSGDSEELIKQAEAEEQRRQQRKARRARSKVMV